MPSEVHVLAQDTQSNKFREVQKPAEYIFIEVGSTLQQYCSTRESQYIQRMRDVWGMIDKGAQAMNAHISANW